MADEFIQQIARLLGQSPDDTRRTLTALAESIREDVENEGEAQIEGIGVFRRDGEALAFEPAPALARAVNHRYAGLKALESGGEPGEASALESDVPEAKSEEPRALGGEESPEPEKSDGLTQDPAAPSEIASSEEALPEETLPEEVSADEASDEVEDAFEEAEAVDFDLPPEPDPDPVRDIASPAPPASEPAPINAGPDPEEALEPDPPEASALDEESEDEAPTEPDAPDAEDPALDVVLGGSTLDEDALVESHLDTSPEPGADEDLDDAEIDALLEGVWSAPADQSDDHPLGTTPPDDAEEADFDLIEEPDDEAAAASPPVAIGPDDGVEPEPTETPAPTGTTLSEPLEGSDDQSEPLEDQPETDPAPAAPPPEPHDAPGFAATASGAAVAADADRPVRDREARAPRDHRRSRAPIFFGLAAVVLVALGLFWWMNREPVAPAVTEGPVPADTSEVAAAVVPNDSAAQADPVALDAATNPSTEPAASEPVQTAPPSEPADPLRGAAGIDRADGGFSWIVASEFSREPAERRVADFRDRGFRADVIAEETGGRTRYRVALGQFASIEEAERFRSDLPAGVPPDTWLLRL